MFFWVSVGRTFRWSPARCAGAKSPRSALETLTSRISWRAVSRVIRTTRFSALPYWCVPRMIAMAGC